MSNWRSFRIEVIPNFEPIVGFTMKVVIFVAQCLGGDVFLQCLGFGGRAILVRAANVKCSTIPGTYIQLCTHVLSEEGLAYGYN